MKNNLSIFSSFFESQAKVRDGIYNMEIVDLNNIDVVFKNIANRQFFYWDENIDQYIDEIKSNFYETPPVILEKLNGKYYSVDGHHRITAGLELGIKNILAFTINVEELTHIRN